MGYSDETFAMRLGAAKAFRVGDRWYFKFHGRVIPYTANLQTLDAESYSKSLRTYWLDCFTDEQREQLQQQATALMVARRLTGAKV
jgi:hypothetical protein